MSTVSEMLRMPASPSLAIIQGGVGLDASMPRTTRVTKTVAPTLPRIGATSSTVTANPVPATGDGASAGSRNVAPVEWEYSRAMPRIENA